MSRLIGVLLSASNRYVFAVYWLFVIDSPWRRCARDRQRPSFCMMFDWICSVFSSVFYSFVALWRRDRPNRLDMKRATRLYSFYISIAPQSNEESNDRVLNFAWYFVRPKQSFCLHDIWFDVIKSRKIKIKSITINIWNAKNRWANTPFGNGESYIGNNWCEFDKNQEKSTRQFIWCWN